jgi:hypothetical protein
MNTTVINLLGGSGVGKSTVAADLYSKMKRLHLKVELVREVAKEWAWEKRPIGPFDQISILGEQIRKESMFFGKVDFIVTDSPSILGAFYFNHNYNQQFMNQTVQAYYIFSRENNVKFVNFILPRLGHFETSGRYETEEQARIIDTKLVEYLDKHRYDYTHITCKQDSQAEVILDSLSNLLINRKE